jgi:TPR repeat protein
MKVTHLIFMILTSLILSACASYEAPRPNAHTVTNSPATMSYLEQGKRYFDQGYFKSAMHTLLPLACDGDPEAQYAVGYMYYYGYGVAQDTDVGYFWICRSANQHFLPAIKALELIERDKDAEFKLRDKLRD